MWKELALTHRVRILIHAIIIILLENTNAINQQIDAFILTNIVFQLMVLVLAVLVGYALDLQEAPHVGLPAEYVQVVAQAD